MSKLSRTSRYKDLRDQLDEETTQAQVSDQPSIQLTRNQEGSAAHQNQSRYNLSDSSRSSGVLDDLLGEVKQYNISQGQRTIEDTQFNILETLSDAEDPSRNRALHIEPMEENLNPAGTTMNMERINIASFPGLSGTRNESVSETLIVREKPVVREERDDSGLFDLGAEDFDRTIRQSTPKPVKKQKSKRKDRTSEQSSTQSIAIDRKKGEENSSGGWLNVFLGILIVLLLISIGFTIYLIIQTGIL